MLFHTASIATEPQEDGSGKTKLFLVAVENRGPREVIKEARKHGNETKADEVTLNLRGLAVVFSPTEEVDEIHTKYLKAIEERAFAYQCYRPEEDTPVASRAPVYSL